MIAEWSAEINGQKTCLDVFGLGFWISYKNARVTSESEEIEGVSKNSLKAHKKLNAHPPSSHPLAFSPQIALQIIAKL